MYNRKEEGSRATCLVGEAGGGGLPSTLKGGERACPEGYAIPTWVSRGPRRAGRRSSAVIRRRASRRGVAGSQGGPWGEFSQASREGGLLIHRKADEFHTTLVLDGPRSVGVSVARDRRAVDDPGGEDGTTQHSRKFECPARAWAQGVLVRDAGSDNADVEKLDLHKSEHSSADRSGHADSSSSASV